MRGMRNKKEEEVIHKIMDIAEVRLNVAEERISWMYPIARIRQKLRLWTVQIVQDALEYLELAVVIRE